MSTTIDDQLNHARDLIIKKRYQEARRVLHAISSDPTAKYWLTKLDAIDPTLTHEPAPASTSGANLPTDLPSRGNMLESSNTSVAIELKNIATGAVLATMVAAISVLIYLVNTGVGGGFLSTPLINYVTGASFGSSAFQSTEALFVITARFFLCFGGSWLPLAALAAVLSSRKKRRK